MSRTPIPRLLLVGGGHAHLEVVRRLAGHREASATLLNPGPSAAYSGMLPGLIAGHYRFEEAHVDLASLCARSGVEFVSAKATRIDPDACVVSCDDGVSRSFDIVSIDVGSTPGISDIPGALENAVPLKPVAPFLARLNGVLSPAAKGGATPRRVVVVGGGAGGVELVLAMHHRCSAGPQREPGRAIRFALVSENLLPGHAQRLQEVVSVILADRGIALERGRVQRLTPGCVHMSEARTLLSDFVVFATGASAPAWLAHSGLASDERGFISVDSHLRSVSHANVFAAGDVATMVARPAPKSGVYAVRAGPVLAENLIAATRGRSPQTTFEPQRRALALIASGNQHATLSYGSLVLSAHWLWRWKDRIDRRFVRKYAAG